MTKPDMSIAMGVWMFVMFQPFAYGAWRMSGYENKTAILMELFILLFAYVFYAIDEVEVRV